MGFRSSVAIGLFLILSSYCKPSTGTSADPVPEDQELLTGDLHPFTRIAGGVDNINQTSAPFLARIAICPAAEAGLNKIYNCVTICSGSILHTRWILTAAHCAVKPTDLLPRKEQLFVFGRNSSGVEYTQRTDAWSVAEVRVHPEYNYRQSHIHNLALLRIDRRLVWNQYLQPIALPPNPTYEQAMYRGDNVTAYGYGSRSATATKVETAQYLFVIIDQLDVVLRNLSLPIVNMSICNSIYFNNLLVLNDSLTMLCYGGEPNKGLCMGDDGGPTVWTRQRDNFRILIAVNTDFYGCTRGQPNLGTKVAGEQLAWIKRFIYT